MRTENEWLAIIWAGRKIVAFCVIVAALIVVLYLHRAERRYRAQVSIVAAQSEMTMGGSGLSSIATMAGIQLPGSEGITQFGIYTQTIRQIEVARAIAKDDVVMRAIFSSRWNSRTGQWQESQSVSRTVVNSVKSLLGFTIAAWRKPDEQDVLKYLNKNLMVDEDQRKSILTLSIEDKNPKIALNIIEKIHITADAIVRARSLVRSEDYIRYLEARLLKTTVAEHREALTRSLSEHEKLSMMAKSPLPFAAEPLSSVYVSRDPTSPDAGRLLVISIVLGFLGGVMAVLLRHQWRSATGPSALPTQ
jgi:uncharacterized protein involved in exopolysaccharide biosynthesis